jgi:acetyltransferase-like isoleucine patch superfamily enzyme
VDQLLADHPSRTPAGEFAETLRSAPAPLRGGPLTLLRFMRSNHMLRLDYARLLARFALLKLRHRGRLQTDGICFICPGVKLEIGREARLRIGRWAWIGHDCKIRVHEGEVSIGAKTVMGQECTISAFQHVSIGRECIIADRIGHNVWIGYGACILRGVTVGENSVIGTSSVVTRTLPANAVIAGNPARVIRMRDEPTSMRWEP